MGERDALSIRNPKVQDLRRLIGRRRSRLEQARFTFEGPTLLADALDAGVAVDAVFVDAENADRHAGVLERVPPSVPVHVLAPGVAERIADTTSPQGVFTVARRDPVGLESLVRPAGGWLVVLDGIADPGNVGAVVRAAEAFGARGVVSAGGGADPFGPKAVRAAAGSTFRLPIVEHPSSVEAVQRARDAGFDVCVTVVPDGMPPNEVDLTGAVATVLGSEAHGVAADVRALADRAVTIRTAPEVESLNVASVAAIVGYERQRQLAAGEG